MQISDLTTNYGGTNSIDKEVEGTLVAASNVVYADDITYVKVKLTKYNICIKKNTYKKFFKK